MYEGYDLNATARARMRAWVAKHGSPPATAADDDFLCRRLDGGPPRSPSLFVCTRPIGHSGPHAAYTGPTTCIDVWEDS